MREKPNLRKLLTLILLLGIVISSLSIIACDDNNDSALGGNFNANGNANANDNGNGNGNGNMNMNGNANDNGNMNANGNGS